MPLEIKEPKLEAIIRDRLDNGEYADLNELLTKALEALPRTVPAKPIGAPRKRLIDVLMSPAFAKSGLKTARIKELPELPIKL